MGVPDLGGEEFGEAPPGPLAGLFDDGGQVEGDAGERSRADAGDRGGGGVHGGDYTPRFCVQ